MKKAYLRYVFLTGCILSLTACDTGKDTSEENNANYVIQEIIPAEKKSAQTDAAPIIEQQKEKVPALDGMSQQLVTIENSAMELNIGSVVNVDTAEIVDEKAVELIKEMPAKTIVKVVTANSATLSQCFYGEDISPIVFSRMENNSFCEGSTVDINTLSYVRVLYFGFDGEIHIGELVVNKLIEEDIISIFKELFDARYPIEQIVLVDDYDADQEESFKADNTTGFNMCYTEGNASLTSHSYGLAVDINPLYNPSVNQAEDQVMVYPQISSQYADRTKENKYYIKNDDVLYRAFINRGFTWGGDWENSPEYCHFEKVTWNN